MNNVIINSARTVAVTGHRKIEEVLDQERLISIFNQLIERGYDTFLVGMAIGFDSICFRKLEEIRKEKRIKIIACIPCATQAERFSLKQKKEYEEMVKSADEKVVLQQTYTAWCMQKRNEFMVDNSSVLVSYRRRETGGTANTEKYAEKKGKEIIRI